MIKERILCIHMLYNNYGIESMWCFLIRVTMKWKHLTNLHGLHFPVLAFGKLVNNHINIKLIEYQPSMYYKKIINTYQGMPYTHHQGRWPTVHPMTEIYHQVHRQLSETRPQRHHQSQQQLSALMDLQVTWEGR